MTDKKPEIFNFDGEYGTMYQTISKHIIPGYDVLYQLEEALLHTSLGTDARILIVGAGGGQELVTLGVPNQGWTFTGVEPSEAMLTGARQRAEQHNLQERIRFHHGFAHELPEDELYDGATCNLVMHFIPDDADRLALLQSIAKRLKPGASLMFSTMIGDIETAEFKRFLTANSYIMRTIGFTPEQLHAMQNVVGTEIIPVPNTKVEALLQQAGFEHISQFNASLLLGGWVATKPL
ncbi:MAG: class I SAM-dependent methyltransferase [Tumebacillaceae bacterium]